MRPDLSIVIPTMGRTILLRTLESLVATKAFPTLEVLVVGEIRDAVLLAALREMLRRHGNIRHLSVSYAQGDSSRKKNIGARESRASIVAFLDDDVLVSTDWPAHVREAFLDPVVGLVSGPGLVPTDINLTARLAGLALASRAAGYAAERYGAGRSASHLIGWSRIIGCNAAYRRSVFEQIGGFPPDFYPGEEMLAAWRVQRLGHALMFIPMACVYHYPRQSLSRFWRQMWNYGATRIRLMRAGVAPEWTTLAPIAWVSSLVILGLLATVSPLCAWLLAFNIASYMALSLFVAMETAARTRQWRDLLVAFIIPFMHLSYGLGQWYELIRPNRDFSVRT